MAADPVAFSHRRHAALKLKCVYCHATAETAERAAFPSSARCRTCHIDKPLPKDAKVAPDAPVYVLPDFVFFSHARHAAAKIVCDACHGNVWQQETIQPVLAMKMKACVDCHRSHAAATACNKCHELSQ
jgi:hypothetical protein